MAAARYWNHRVLRAPTLFQWNRSPVWPQTTNHKKSPKFRFLLKEARFGVLLLCGFECLCRVGLWTGRRPALVISQEMQWVRELVAVRTEDLNQRNLSSPVTGLDLFCCRQLDQTIPGFNSCWTAIWTQYSALIPLDNVQLLKATGMCSDTFFIQINAMPIILCFDTAAPFRKTPAKIFLIPPPGKRMMQFLMIYKAKQTWVCCCHDELRWCVYGNSFS